MYLLCDHMISCSNLCGTSLVGGPISLLPCRLPLAFPAFLAAWVAMGHSPCQPDTCRSHLRDSGKAFIFPERRVRPRGYHPFLLLPTMNLNGTSSAVVATRDPRGMTQRITGLKPRTLTNAELLSQRKQCQQLPPSGLLIKQEKTKLSMSKLILLVFSLTCS